MPWYIKSDELGLFIGECLGLGFFEYHISDGTCSPEETPIEFKSKEEAENFLNSWNGGKSDCKVIYRKKKVKGFSNA